MAYIDWDKAEEIRVEQRVAEDMAIEPVPRRRGMQALWAAAERDVEEQEALYAER